MFLCVSRFLFLNHSKISVYLCVDKYLKLTLSLPIFCVCLCVTCIHVFLSLYVCDHYVSVCVCVCLNILVHKLHYDDHTKISRCVDKKFEVKWHITTELLASVKYSFNILCFEV